MDAAQGSEEANKIEVRGQVLGGGIPALSHATGANSVAVLGDENIKNFNMSASDQGPGFETGWPASRLNDLNLDDRWLHSDFKDIAYPFNHKLYDKIVGLGGLKNEN